MADDPLILSDYIGSTSTRLSPFRDYRVLRGPGEAAYLNLFSPPQGQVLATLATRVNHFSELSETLPDLGLPSRMKDCLVYYACWQLLSQRLPVGQEALKLTTRQTETDNTVVSEVTSGSDTQTQTDNKTQTETGTKDGTVEEARAGTQSEVVDLEQTETKNGSVTTTGGETTTDVRTQAVTATNEENMAETTVGFDQVDTDNKSYKYPNLTTTESGSESVDTGEKVTKNEKQSNEQIMVTEHHDAVVETMDWDEGQPPRQTSQTVPAYDITSTTTHPGQGWNKDWTTEEAVEDAQVQHFGKVVKEEGVDYTHEILDDNKRTSLDHESNTHGNKSETTSEDSQGTVVKDQTDTTVDNDLTVSAQEKVTTDDLTTTTTTDEDTTNTIVNTGTQITALEKDTTTATSTEGDKITGIETMATYRDRLQTAQYYKMLLDLEVQHKQMRSWVARGL